MDRLKFIEDRKRIYKISLIGLTIILFLIIGITNRINKSFSIGDRKFTYTGKDLYSSQDYSFKDDQGKALIVDVEEFGTRHSTLADRYKVDYDDKTIYSDSTKLFEEGWEIKVSDGSIHRKDISSLSRDNWQFKEEVFDLQLIDGIERVVAYKSTSSPFLTALIGIVGLALGLLNLIYPDKVWQFNYFLSVKDGEPTDLALIMNRLAGIILIVLSLFVFPLIV